MLSRKTWFALTLVAVVWAVWHAFGTVEIVYNVRHLEDGTVRESKVVCGEAPAIVFFGRFDADVPGQSTARECTAAARTRLLEVGLLGLAAATALFLGIRYGKEPPRPIHHELPRLPTGDRAVEGRRRKP